MVNYEVHYIYMTFLFVELCSDATKNDLQIVWILEGKFYMLKCEAAVTINIFMCNMYCTKNMS